MNAGRTIEWKLGYWIIIAVLLVWIAHQREQIARLEYADQFLRADNQALRARLLGLD